VYGQCLTKLTAQFEQQLERDVLLAIAVTEATNQ